MLRRRRNRMAAAALAIVAVSLLALPERLRSYREQQAAEARLIALQAEIVERQHDLGNVIDQIRRAEAEIRARTKS